MERVDELRDLPGLAAFGERLTAAMREETQAVRPARTRRRRPLRTLVLTALLILAIAAAAAAATVAVLRASVIQAPGAADVPREQKQVLGTIRIAAARAKDPAGGPPWAVRVARSPTGLVCTTIGQMRDGVFGIVGLDGVFRRIPATIVDHCSSTSWWSDYRTVIGRRPQDTRTIGAQWVPKSSRGASVIQVGEDRKGRPIWVPFDRDGVFIYAMRGYGEDQPGQPMLRGGEGFVRDPAGGIGTSWIVQREPPGFRGRTCARVRLARAPLDAPVSTQDLCVAWHGSRDWAAGARRYAPGQHGSRDGLHPWDWRSHAARTVVWGITRNPKEIDTVTLRGAGAPRAVAVSAQGAFAVVLPAWVDPRRLRLSVRYHGGREQRAGLAEGFRRAVVSPLGDLP